MASSVGLRWACVAVAALFVGAASPPSPAPAALTATTDVPFDVLSPDLYRTITLKWNGGSSAPLCAVTRSRRDWEALTRSTVGKGKDGAPTADEWNRHAVMVVGHQIGTPRTPMTFHVDGVHRQGSTIELDYSLTPPPTSGGTTWFAAVAIMKPLTATVTFNENGRVVCTVQPMAGHWATPSPPAAQPAASDQSQASSQPVPPGYALQPASPGYAPAPYSPSAGPPPAYSAPYGGPPYAPGPQGPVQ